MCVTSHRYQLHKERVWIVDIAKLKLPACKGEFRILTEFQAKKKIELATTQISHDDVVSVDREEMCDYGLMKSYYQHLKRILDREVKTRISLSREFIVLHGTCVINM